MKGFDLLTDDFGVLRLRAVAHVEARHIHARTHHALQRFDIAAGRSDGANDLGASHQLFAALPRVTER